MPVAGPWFFAWVDPNTAFNAGVHNRMDEYVFSIKRTLSEGDKPALEVEIRNPHIGLLNPSRKFWAWVSRNDAFNVPQPFFYGRIVAVPSNLFAEVITVQFVSWPIDYFQQKQRIAEAIKISGPYDPVFIDVLKRDDPDTILEALSHLWCVDPVTLQVTTSDIVSGEDGNVAISADQHFYDGLSLEIEQPPLTAIRMDAQVSWTQTYRGFIDMGANTTNTYSGDAMIADWPKPLAQLGAGWSVGYSNAVDKNRTQYATTKSYSYSWQNTQKTHTNGDAMSVSVNMTFPATMQGNSVNNILTMRTQSGVVDPFAVDEHGDPSPINIPMSVDATYIYTLQWSVSTSLVLRYDAARPRTERVVMLLQSDLQATLVDPTVTQNSELMTRNGADVGLPIINLLNWTTVSGTHINVGDIVFPDLPTLPGGRSVQRCTVAGTAGAVEPIFSDISGTPTTDNTVTWSSLGISSPTETAVDWTGVSNVPAGEILLPRQPLFLPWNVLLQSGLQSFPQTGAKISIGEIIQGENGYYFACTLDGTTSINSPTWTTTHGSVVSTGSVQLTCIGPSLPDGRTYYLATTGGQTGPQYIIPNFNPTRNATTTDGSVIWTSIGSGDIPVGGPPGYVAARSYFPSSRGRNSLEYLIAIMRARMLYRARAVRVGFDCPFDTGLSLTCRKTVTLTDSRLPGGQAFGKVTGVEHSIIGDAGLELCKVTIGCVVGKGTVITPVSGTPVYVNGYVAGYQALTGAVVLPANYSDIGYTPPVFVSDDDGLVFPLDKAQIFVSERVVGSEAAQISGIQSAQQSASILATGAENGFTAIAPGSSPLTGAQSFINGQLVVAAANTMGTQLAANSVYYELIIKPVNTGPFFDVYNVTLTNMVAPKGIDLEGASVP